MKTFELSNFQIFVNKRLKTTFEKQRSVSPVIAFPFLMCEIDFALMKSVNLNDRLAGLVFKVVVKRLLTNV